jgi:hypothetical protein
MFYSERMTRRLSACVLLTLACGTSHGPAREDLGADATVVDAGVEIDHCYEILEAPPGAACAEGLECHPPVGFCSFTEAACVAGELRFTPENGWLRDEDDACDPGDVTLTITTPDETLSFDSGAASFSHTFAVNLALVFFAGTDITACETPYLWVTSVAPATSSPMSYVGSYELDATLVLDHELVPLTGTLTVDAQETMEGQPVGVAGTVELSAADITVTGSFSVVECPDLDRGGP